MEYSVSTQAQPVRITINAEYTFTEGGLVKNRLYAGKAEQMQTSDSTYTLLSDGFVLEFYTEAQELDGRLTAKNGFIRGDNSLMVAQDSVVFTNKVGETLYTEELIWEQKRAEVYTNKFVTIERATDIIYGKGLISDENFSSYIIKDPTGTFYLEE